MRQLCAAQLFDKGDFARAGALYAETIGSLEPSVVVRQFLGQARTGELAVYLEELHRRGAAVAAHTNLLMNCYAKNGDRANLLRFVRAAEEGYVRRLVAPDFEVQLAV